MILALIFSFVLGIFFGSFLHFSLFATIFGIVLSGLLFGIQYFAKGIREDKKKILKFSGVIVLGLVIGFARMSISNLYAHSNLDVYVNKKISAEGIVVDEPDVRESNTKLTVGL